VIQKMFTIYDEKAEAYLPPFFLPTREMAIRTFSDCVNSNDHQFGAHPHDYTLFALGEFDNETATLDLSRKLVGNGVEYKIHTPPQKELFDGEDVTAVSDDAPIQSNSEGGDSA